MKTNILRFGLFCLLCVCGVLKVSALRLSDSAKISLITCAPGNDAASVYGHSAIRIVDPVYNYDLAFNYGIYDFDSPNFVYRFASGRTDYLLAAYKFDAFLKSYQKEKRSVYEQDLNLTQKEKQKMYDFLVWNLRPENRVYRYNFFFDNCATRVRDVIVNNVEGGVKFKGESSQKTLRRLIKDYHGRLMWLNVGIDFLVSAPSDREATFWEEMFLPDYVMKHIAGAKRSDGTPVVAETRTLYEAPVSETEALIFAGPFAVFLLLTLLVAGLTVNQFRRQRLKPALDYLLYGLNGFSGVFIGWFVLFSQHPAMAPNYNLMWLVPLNLPFALLWAAKKWRTALKYYHVVLAGWYMLFICFGAFLPQKLHPVFFLFAGIMLVRSLAHSFLFIQKLREVK